MPLLPTGSGQDAALAVLEDRFQPNMTVSDTCTHTHTHPHHVVVNGKCTQELGCSEGQWPNLEVREGFSEEATTGQWSEGREVLFQQITVSCKAQGRENGFCME